MNVEEVYKDLDEKVVLPLEGKEPKEVYENLQKIYHHIIDLMNKKKLEEAYQMCKRWNFCVEWLDKQSSIDKNIAHKYYSPKKDNLDMMKNKREITCEELYEIMHNFEMTKVKVLIIDLRNAEDFAAQKMAFQDNVINIPESKILPNKEANYYEHTVDNNAALKRFQKRVDADLIVLVDLGSTSIKLNIISTFKQFLEEQDEIANYNSIVILQGGFVEWMKNYPELVQKQVIKSKDQQHQIKKQTENDVGFGSPASTNQNTSRSSPVQGVEGASGVGASLFSPNCGKNVTIPFT